jgi:hypothetical protein
MPNDPFDRKRLTALPAHNDDLGISASFPSKDSWTPSSQILSTWGGKADRGAVTVNSDAFKGEMWDWAHELTMRKALSIDGSVTGRIILHPPDSSLTKPPTTPRDATKKKLPPEDTWENKELDRMKKDFMDRVGKPISFEREKKRIEDEIEAASGNDISDLADYMTWLLGLLGWTKFPKPGEKYDPVPSTDDDQRLILLRRAWLRLRNAYALLAKYIDKYENGNPSQWSKHMKELLGDEMAFIEAILAKQYGVRLSPFHD